MTALELVTQLGRQNVIQRLALSESSLSTALGDNRFPARWYQGFRELADEVGVECPMELFAWREAAA